LQRSSDRVIYDEEAIPILLAAFYFGLMDALLTAVDSQTVLLIGAIVVSLLFLQLLFRILNASWEIILAIGAIVVVLHYFFGVSPNQLLTEISQLPQELLRLVQNLNLPELGILYTMQP
jgi:hypothetical protein